MESNNFEVAKRLKEIREKLNYSQNEIANIIGVSRSAYTNNENGKYRISEKTLRLICDKFNINYDYLKFGKGEMFNDTSRNQNNTNNLNNLDNHNNQNNNNNTYSYSNNKNNNNDISEIDKIRIDRDIEVQGLYSDEAGILKKVAENLSNEECKIINDMIVRLAHEILKKRSEKR